MLSTSDLEIYTPVSLVSPTIVCPSANGASVYGITVKGMTAGVDYKNAIITSGVLYRYNGTPGDVVYAANGTLVVSPVPGAAQVGIVLSTGDLMLSTNVSVLSGTPAYIKSFMSTSAPIVISAVPKSVTITVDQITLIVEDDYTETIENGVVTSIVPLTTVEGMVVIRYLEI